MNTNKTHSSNETINTTPANNPAANETINTTPANNPAARRVAAAAVQAVSVYVWCRVCGVDALYTMVGCARTHIRMCNTLLQLGGLSLAGFGEV